MPLLSVLYLIAFFVCHKIKTFSVLVNDFVPTTQNMSASFAVCTIIVYEELNRKNFFLIENVDATIIMHFSVHWDNQTSSTKKNVSNYSTFIIFHLAVVWHSVCIHKSEDLILSSVNVHNYKNYVLFLMKTDKSIT